MKPNLLRRLESLVTKIHSRLNRIRRIIENLERLVIEVIIVCILFFLLIGSIVLAGKIIWYLLVTLNN